MRFFVKVLWDIEKGNELARAGTMGSTVASILEEQRPEAAYFKRLKLGRCVSNTSPPPCAVPPCPKAPAQALGAS